MLDWVMLLGGLTLLVIGAEFLVQAAVKFALYLRISSMVVGLTVVAMGTSFPELVVSVNAALTGHPDISVGNVIGSNIVNISFILGAACLILPMRVERASVVIDWPVMVGATGLFFLLSLNGLISRLEGAVMFLLLVVYNVYLIRKSRMDSDEREDAADQPIEGAELIRSAIILVLSITALVYGSDWMVQGAVEIARSYNIEEKVIGVTIVAFGTSAPELATSVVAALRNNQGVSLGNLIGSNIFNVLGIMGFTAFIHPVHVNPSMLEFDYWWALAIPVILFVFIITRLVISRLEALLLIAAYFFYIFLLI